MPTWIGHLISGLFGAIVTGVGMTLMIVNRLAKVENRVDALEKTIEMDRDRTSERIFQVADMMKSVLATANEVLKQNTVLIAEIRAERKGHDE